MRSEEKWIFFPSWTGSSFFAQHSTDWEPAAMRKRNPPNPSEVSVYAAAVVLLREDWKRIEGVGAGGKGSPIESWEKILLL